MLDDINFINQRDSAGALSVVANFSEQALFEPHLDGQLNLNPVTNVVISGVGGAVLAGDITKVLLKDRLSVPLEVIRGYDLPRYINRSTLIIVIGHSGNTDEALTCLDQTTGIGAPMVVVSTGGELVNRARRERIPVLTIPAKTQARFSTIYYLKGLLKIFEQHGLSDSQLRDEISSSADWLESKIAEWMGDVPTEHNYAKQLAWMTVGKTAVFYGGQITGPLAYKWKTSWNETAKNIAFAGQYPEASHNELTGWSSHPIEKQFAVFDIQSSFERPKIIERMELTNRMLSGMRPSAVTIICVGDGLVRQILWSIALADATSIYGAILNNVNPMTVDLSDRFKETLS